MHQLADDGNENRNYIACLFIFETAIQTALSIISTISLNKSWKIPKTFIFVLSFLKLNFQGNWNLRLGKIKRANSVNS